jgi:hypothetical protein
MKYDHLMRQEKSKPSNRRSPNRSKEFLSPLQIEVLSDVARGLDPIVHVRDRNKMTKAIVNLQGFIDRGWVIYNRRDQYELTPNGQDAYKAVHHANG